jgi:hypothetical protein
MPEPDDILQLGQDAIVSLLQADDWFAPAGENPVTVIAEEKGDVDVQIQTAVKRLGACVLVMMGRALCERPNIPGPFFDRIEYVLEIAENALLNRGATGTGKTARQIAHRVCRLVHHHKPTGFGGIFRVSRDAIVLAQNPPGATVTYQVNVSIPGGIEP